MALRDPQQWQAGSPALCPHQAQTQGGFPPASAAPSAGLATAPGVGGTPPEGGEHLPAPHPPGARQHPTVEGQPGHGPRLQHILLEEVLDLQVGLQRPQRSHLVQHFLV